MKLILLILLASLAASADTLDTNLVATCRVLQSRPETNAYHFASETNNIAGIWDAAILQHVEVSFPCTNGLYRVQFKDRLQDPCWEYVTWALNGAEKTNITLTLATPMWGGFFRVQKLR